jgi:hypothetical protein
VLLMRDISSSKMCLHPTEHGSPVPAWLERRNFRFLPL